MVSLERDIHDGLEHQGILDPAGLRALDRAQDIYLELQRRYYMAMCVETLYRQYDDERHRQLT